MNLRPYQLEIIDAAFTAWDGGVNRALAIAATGAGKTIVAAEIMRRAPGRCLFLADAIDIVTQNAAKFEAHTGESCGVEMADRSASLTDRVVIASSQTLGRRIHRYPENHFGTIICDECFPAGTMIGGTPIEKIKVGDPIESFNETTGRIEMAKVIDAFSNSARRLVEIKAGGALVKATEQHPFFTQNGWVAACELTEQHFVLLYEENHHTEVRLLRDGVRDEHESAFGAPQESDKQMVLLEGVPKCHHVGAPKGEESYVQRGVEGEDAGVAPWPTVPNEARREWFVASSGAVDNRRTFGLEDGAFDPDEEAARLRIPDLLQSGHRERASQGCNRDRRAVSQLRQREGCGREERRVLKWARVESVSLQKVEGATEPDGCGAGCAVFNLTVEPNNTYIANGFVVHNCHRNSLGTYPQRIFSRFPAAKVLGLTATPWRTDGKGLGDFYERIVAEVGLRRLVSEGWLSRIIVKSVPLPINLNGVRTTAGDYNDGDLAHVIAPHLREAVAQLKKHAQGRKTVVYLPLVALSKEFARIAREEGLNAAHADGTDRAAVAEFAAGKYDIISNAALLTTGWDCPAVDCILPLRPTKSLSLFAQIVGRGTRVAPGKKDLLLLDPLYLTSDYSLAKPAQLICSRPPDEKKDDMAAREGDLFEIERDILAERAEKLANELKAKQRKAAVTRDALELSKEVDSRPWYEQPPSSGQLWCIRQAGINTSSIRTKGDAQRIIARIKSGAPSAPKQKSTPVFVSR